MSHSRRHPIETRVLRQVANGCRTPREVARRLRLNHNTTRSAMARMAERGQLIRSHTGFYELPNQDLSRPAPWKPPAAELSPLHQSPAPLSRKTQQRMIALAYALILCVMLVMLWYIITR